MVTQELAGLRELHSADLQPLITAHKAEMAKTKAAFDEQTKELQKK